MEEQNQNSVNLGIPSRWRRFSAYFLDLIINLMVFGFIPYFILTFTDGSIISLIIIVILIIFEIAYVIYKKTTHGNKAVGIIALTNDGKPISCLQSLLRYFVFNPAFLALILLLIRFFISLMLYMINGGCRMLPNDTIVQDPVCKAIRTIQKFGNRSSILSFIFLLISIIEIFFKCPTFIDKRLGIKRFYKKNK